MTKPTDAELWQLHMQMPGVHKNPIDFARAVLAKWSTPPAVAGEPFCYVSVNKQGDITRTMKRKDKWTNIPLYTTPQPTQPQTRAVPQGWKAVPVNPTPEMWKAAKTVPNPNPPYPPHYSLVWDAMLAAAPSIEQGGQHDNNT